MLPYNSIQRVWGGSSHGEVCDACDGIVAMKEWAIEGISLGGGRNPLQLHVESSTSGSKSGVWYTRSPLLGHRQWDRREDGASRAGHAHHLTASAGHVDSNICY